MIRWLVSAIVMILMAVPAMAQQEETAQQADTPARPTAPIALEEQGKADSLPLLHRVIFEGDTDKAKELIRSGEEDINAQDAMGRTPLFVAIAKGNLELTRLLLDQDGIKPMLATKQDWQPLHMAAKRGDSAKARMLTAHQLDVNAQTKAGETPLFLAAQYGHLPIVKLLVALNADMNQANASGLTPLYAALERNQLDVGYFLLTEGAHVNVSDEDGHFLAFRLVEIPERAQALQMLLDHNLRLSRRNDENQTLLDAARALGHNANAEVLRVAFEQMVRDYYERQGKTMPENVQRNIQK